LPGTVELAKDVLRLPSNIGYPKPLGGILDSVDSPDFATAVGLVLLARERGRTHGNIAGIGFLADGAKRAVPEWALSVGKKTRDWLRKFLPLD
jgi:cell division ATPase FtsA